MSNLRAPGTSDLKVTPVGLPDDDHRKHAPRYRSDRVAALDACCQLAADKKLGPDDW